MKQQHMPEFNPEVDTDIKTQEELHSHVSQKINK